MALRDIFRLGRRRSTLAGPEGIQVRVRTHNVPGAERSGRAFPGPLWWGLIAAVVFYLGAHLAIATGVWPVHGVAPGAGYALARDLVSLAAWLLVLFVMRRMGYRGSWAVVVFPILIFALARPSLFQVFTDPAYQARGRAKTEANEAKATRSRLYTIDRAYSDERKAVVFQGEPPALPDPFRREVAKATAGSPLRLFTHFTVFVAPVALLIGFWLARKRGAQRWFRDHKLVPFVPTLAAFFALALFFTSLGKVGGFTPWELFLPLFVATWAATLADDAYNLARPGEAFRPHRVGNLLLYGLGPLIPFLVIRELGLSIVLAGSLAAMLLVGTRRGWWAGLMMLGWAAIVFAAFNVDERSSTRLELAYDPYKELSSFETEDAREKWAAKLHQMKLFDANVLAGGVLGEGPGQGHGETAPNAADDGFVTLFAAQWGVAGTVSLVLLYTLFLLHLLSVAVRERGAFERTLVTGVAMLIGIPFWLAVLGGIRVIPLTGVAAAFAANGGAKLLASAFAVGLVAGISHRRFEEDRLESALAPPTADAQTEGVRIR